MLKYVYKVLLISILSGSLIQSTMAQNVHDQTVNNLVNKSKETVKTDAIKDSDLMGTLTMTAVGVLASRLYTYKPTTDIMVAAAGGAMFIAGEVLAFLKLKSVMKGMEAEIARDSKGNVNREQIASLERLKQSYIEAKKTANTKKTLQMAAAAAFAAAGVLAFTMTAVDLSNLTACTTATTSSLAVAAAAIGKCTGSAAAVKACIAAVKNCIGGLKAFSTAMMAEETARQAVGPSAAGLTAATSTKGPAGTTLAAAAGMCSASVVAAEAAGIVTGGCSSKFPTDAIGESGGFIDYGLFIHNSPIKTHPLLKERFNQDLDQQKMANNKIFKYIEKTLSFIFPSANAALFSAMGIASSAAMAYLLATSATLGPTIDFFMLIPQKRAIVWGVLAGLTFLATTATNNVIAQIDANISKIDAILNSLYKMADGATATQATLNPSLAKNSIMPKTNTGLNISANNYDDVDLTKEAKGGLPCYTGPEDKKCKSFEDSVKDIESFKGMTPEAQQQITSMLKTADGFNGTSKITAGAIKGAAVFGGSANALKSALDKSKADAAERLKKLGSSFNINDQTKAFSDSLEKGVHAALKKSNSTPSGMFANMYGGVPPSTTSGSAEQKAGEEILNKGAGATANIIDISGGGMPRTDSGLSGINTGSSQPTTAEVAAYDNAAKGAGDINDYDLKNDITTDSGSSIFDVISNRYQRSGYPRLFKPREAQPPSVKK